MRASKIILIGVVAVLVGVLGLVGAGTALAWGPFGGMMGGYGSDGPGRGDWGGMMGGYGPSGMMGGWTNQGNQTQGQQVTLDQAVKNVQAYVDNTGDNDLVIDEVMEFQNNFYAIVKEKSTGNGAFELLVSKTNGSVFPEMGPNMMWNTKYGMHPGGANGGYGGMMGSSTRGQGMMGSQYQATAPTGPMTVTSEQAKTIAQQWLNQNQPGVTTEAPDQFYGYYTVHTLKEGKISGMLSVNGYTSQVWYHNWHGAFVQVREQN